MTRMGKRRIGLALSGLILLWVGALPAFSQVQTPSGQPQAVITVESADVPQGAEATIQVTVKDIPADMKLVSYQGTLSFNPAVIEVLRVEFPPDCPVTAAKIEAEVVRFAATKCPGPQGEEGIAEGELFRLIIKAAGAVGQTATLNPAFEFFHNRQFQLIPHRVVPGIIRIISGVNQPPVADFDWTPPFPSARDTLQFLDRSRDPDGRITRWLWDFGDGTTSDVQTPSHRFAQSGIYTVRLTVTDNRGASGEVVKRLYVFQAPGPNEILVTVAPNPARTFTRFVYFLPEGTTQATLFLFDLLGRPVLTRPLDVTRREFFWDLRDERGSPVPNGPYFFLVRAATPGGVLTSRVEVLVIQR